MTERLFVPASEVRIERKESNSRFIATAAPTFSVEEARRFIKRVRAEFSDADHNVPAYLIGHGPATVAHCHDDAEPGGTAGRPILAVLQGSGLGDITLVVTRYFGGTKLGTGGLVRAYGDAARELLETIPRAEKVRATVALVSGPYSLVDRIRLLANAHDGAILDEAFAAEVTFTLRFPALRFPAFRDALYELSHGQVEAIVVEEDQTMLVPVPVDAS